MNIILYHFINDRKINSNMTKAETLKFLSKHFKQEINIPKFFFINIKDLNKNYSFLYKKIKYNFKNKNIILRSSSISEDQKNISNAGKYDSIVIKKLTIENLEKSIIKIIKKFNSKKDQILIQEYIDEPDISGVLFTRDINTNAPYYILNYDKSGKTNLVTSGKKNFSIKEEIFFKGKKIVSSKFSKLLNLTKKIEKLLNNDRLDIEFAIKNKKTYFFQCRPLKKIKFLKQTKTIDSALLNIEKKIKKLKVQQPNIIGKTTVFSNMSDWNPAEMIGSKSTPLSFSLYSELITNKIWSSQRFNYGYKKVTPHRLMVNLAGSPYIDLRVDFNSFLPKNLPINIQKKSIDYYIREIKKNPWKHDKIEFDLIPTCFDFELSKKFKLFLNKKEAYIYSENLKKLTNKILNKKKSPFVDDLKKIDLLDEKINQIKNTKLSSIHKIFNLIEICKEYGTLPFAGIARAAFISTQLIRSLEKKKILNVKELNLFYESNKIIADNINFDLERFNKKKISKKYFLSKYGHLRPSTYSISSLNYKEGFDLYFSKINYKNKLRKNVKFKLKKSTEISINKILKKSNLSIRAIDLFKFAKKSIEKREEAKFIFTKVLNLIFENLIVFSREIKIPRNDLEYMSINTIQNAYNYLGVEKIRKQINNEIYNNKKNFRVSNLIKLPDVINNPKDVYCHYKTINLGNFITEKKVNGNIFLINSKTLNLRRHNLENKIILIENADPGYDFIFSHNIKGLVTKYGGTNSHMAIRCLEYQLPAVIGIGEQKFDYLSKKNFIEIDCSKNLITDLS